MGSSMTFGADIVGSGGFFVNRVPPNSDLVPRTLTHVELRNMICRGLGGICVPYGSTVM